MVGLREDAQFQQHAYLRRGTGQVSEIAPPQGRRISTVRDINNGRQVLVTTISDTTGFRDFLWRQGQFSRLNPLPGSQSTTASRINDLGIAVGTAIFSDRSAALLWENGMLMPLARPQGSTFVFGIDVSNDGTVLMNATFPTALAHTGVVLWKEGQLRALRPLSGQTWADASDISNRNVVVGRSFSDSSATGMVATLWRGSNVVNLNTRVLNDDPLKPFVRLQWGLLVSDWGFIVARGVDSRNTDGRISFYLLTPH